MTGLSNVCDDTNMKIIHKKQNGYEYKLLPNIYSIEIIGQINHCLFALSVCH